MSASAAWATVLAASLVLGVVSAVLGTATEGFGILLLVAVLGPGVVVHFVSARVPAMGDRRFLFVPGAIVCSFVGAVLGFLAIGMVLK